MPRKLRVQYPGAMNHVMSRGDRREDIYLNDVDRQDFVKTLAETFRKQMLELMEDKLGDHHSGELRRESAEAKAERIISEQMNRLGWNEAKLASAQKTHPAKLAIAARLRRETTLPIKAIAQLVHLGTTKAANARLHATMREPNHAPSPQTELKL